MSKMTDQAVDWGRFLPCNNHVFLADKPSDCVFYPTYKSQKPLRCMNNYMINDIILIMSVSFIVHLLTLDHQAHW